MEKQYYWLRLKDNFFDEKYIKALRRLPNGDTLTIIYMKMQLKSLNTAGYLYYENLLPDSISELALVLDEKEEDVKAAVEALVRFGAVERQEDESFYMSAMQEIIGTETSSAARVRKHRENKMLQCNAPVTECNAPVTECNTKCNTEKEKEKEIEKEIEIDKEQEKEKKSEKESEAKTQERFHPPTLKEVTDYCLERKNNINPEKFIDYYTANGWMVGRGRMKDWRAAVRNWERNSCTDIANESPPLKSNSSFTAEELERSAYERYRRLAADKR